MKKYLFIYILCCFAAYSPMAAQPNTSNQDASLAQQYLTQGDYEKAAALYAELYEENPRTTVFYRNLFKSLMGLKKWEDAEKLVRKQLKSEKADPSLYLDLGFLYKETGEVNKATTEFDRALEQVKDVFIGKLANDFINIGEDDYAIKAYLRGRELQKNNRAFARELAGVYQQKNDMPNAISNCLDYAATLFQPSQSTQVPATVTMMLQRMLNKGENQEILQSQLYSRIQKEPEQNIYTELLVWLFVQQKDFESALIQAKAIDRRQGEEGYRLLDLAMQAIKEEQYDAAIDAYQYLIDKGEESPLFMESRMRLLACLKEKITHTSNYTHEDLEKLKTDYLEFLNKLGRNPSTAGTMRELSHLYAFYLNDVDSAAELSEAIVNMPSAEHRIKAQSKLDLGDYFLIKDDIWEASLYYSQVDKAFKEDILGEEARFRNAKLSYYNGDFEWAQAQLNALKASTSELIANDAIKLSVFITDNSGLDTITTPMKLFAHADLLLLQNKTDETWETLDSINMLYPGHALSDDVLMLRANIEIKKRKYVEAAEFLHEILDKFKTDILADDALFTLADLYQSQLNDKQKAMELYQAILTDHPDSLYTIEARKRFRKLRDAS